jgi:hypothetical protein
METVTPFNIDNLLGRVKNRVRRVGVELEGAWKKLPAGTLTLEHDGSVFRNRKPVGYNVGELPLSPIVPAALPNVLRHHYPHKVNSTCGMHVHMSFSTLWHYNLLMVPEYQETIVHYVTLWAKKEKFKDDHHIWARLRGESEFCLKEFWPDIQASTKRKTHSMGALGHRYTMIHYCGRQMTIECRLLPMMAKTDQAIRAIQLVIDITNACLYMLGPLEKRGRIVNALNTINENSYEEFIEESL